MGDRVLLTVSGRIPGDLDDQIAAGRRPRADYRVMAHAFGADLVDEATALASVGRFGRALHRYGGVGPLLGWYCFRHRREYDVIVTDGEQAGIPLALLCRLAGRGTARYMMIVHIVSTASKSRIIRWAGLARLIDRFVVYSAAQRDFVLQRFGAADHHVIMSTFMVDTEFFDPAKIEVAHERMICAAGLERRDYPTLMDAVDGLDVRVVIAASSPWSTKADSSAGRPIPPNVEIQRLSLFELRDLYAAARFVVMPLVDVDFQAGITTILEAMSMAKPVLCTRTTGQTDTIVEGETGWYVPPADVVSLRATIVKLLDDDVATREAGVAARDWAVANADVAVYARRLAGHLRELCPGAAPSAS